MTSVMWFRNDLRLDHNVALKNAFDSQDKLLLIFHVNPQQFLSNSHNHNAFFQSVVFFQKEVNQKLKLQILFGELEPCFRRLKQQVPEWNRIFFNAAETGYGLKRDRQMEKFFTEQKIQIEKSFDHYIHEAEEILKPTKEKYKVFTPYFKQWIQQEKPTPVKVRITEQQVITTSLFPKDEQKFQELVTKLPKKTLYSCGNKAAQQQLQHFLNIITDYNKSRDFPSKNGTSKLSPYLRTGELSVRSIWQALDKLPSTQGVETFKKELCWRDFYHMIYTENPNQKSEAIRPEFNSITWQNNEENFDAWKAGKTGFPIVDAAMRQLRDTGWMHNRLRMLTASFLTKDLLIDWRLGEGYFQKMLIDYDPANNIGGWQWAASTGTDAVPYFRIFNPTTQAKKFDPQGDYIRSFLPELNRLPNKFIHDPSTMSKKEQSNYQFHLGKDYPIPIVDHQDARKKAIVRYQESKEWYTETPKE